MKIDELYEYVNGLKNLVRTGWINRNVGGGGVETNKTRLESDPEHTFSCQILAMQIISEKHLPFDTAKVLQMLLFHDVAEGKIGDYTPGTISKEEKFALESAAAKEFALKFNMPCAYESWIEFETGESEEAKFCRDIDKLDTICQAKFYATKFESPALFNEFYAYGKNKIKTINIDECVAGDCKKK